MLSFQFLVLPLNAGLTNEFVWLAANCLSLSQGLVFQQIHLKKKNKNTKFFLVSFPLVWNPQTEYKRTVLIYQRIQNDRLKIVLIWRLQRWQPSGRFVIKQDPGWRLRMARVVPLTSSPLHSTLLLLLYIQLLLLQGVPKKMSDSAFLVIAASAA